jgi:ferritin-like metal-binding protein YciE
MAMNEPMEAFVMLLSHVRHTTEQSNKIYEELSNRAEDPAIKEALEARAFVQKSSLEKIDQAFNLIGQKPVELTGRLQEAFLEDFRGDVEKIQRQGVRRLFILSKVVKIVHLRIAEWVALVAAADSTGNYGVGVLLETCLAEDLAFAERTRRLIRKYAEGKISARSATS